MEFLTFHVGEREFAVDLARVREIINPPPITRVPGMPPALLGLVGLRGDPTAVVDAGLRLDARPVVLSARTPLIVLTVRLLDRSMEVALLVEAAGRKLELESLLPWSEGLARFAGSDACTGFADVDGRIVLVLDVDQLMAFDRIAAASVLSLPAPAPTTVAAVATATNSRSLDSPSPPRRGGEARGEGAERSALPPPSEKLPVTQPRVERRRAELPAPRAAAHTATAQGAVAPAPPAPPLPRHWTPARPAAPLQPAANAGDGWTRFTAQPSAAARTVGPPSAVATHHATPPPAPPRRDEPPAPTPPPITPTSTRRLGWIVAGVGAALLVLLALFVGSIGGTDRRPEPSSVSPEPRAAPAPSSARPVPPPSFTEAAPPPRREPAAVPEPPAPAAHFAPAPPPTPAAPPAPVAAPMPVAPPAPAPARAARALPPAMIVTPDTPACEIHEVKKGESLWLISARLLGDPYKWPKVYGENRDRILDPNLIEIDDRIRIPGACNAARAR